MVDRVEEAFDIGINLLMPTPPVMVQRT